MELKKNLITAVICGAIICGFNESTQAAEISLDNQIEIQQLSHWTQFRDGFYKNVLGINRDKDSDRDSRHEHHRPHHHNSHKHHHYR